MGAGCDLYRVGRVRGVVNQFLSLVAVRICFEALMNPCCDCRLPVFGYLSRTFRCLIRPPLCLYLFLSLPLSTVPFAYR